MERSHQSETSAWTESTERRPEALERTIDFLRDEYGTDFVLNTDLLLSISEAMQDDEPIDRARIKGWRRELCDRNAAHRRFINGLNRAGFSDAEQRESIIWLKTAVEQQYLSESELARLTSDQDAAAG